MTLTDEYGALNIFMLPFIKPLSVRALYGDDTIHTFDDAVRACIAHTQIDTKERNIIMTHHFVVAGSEKPELSDSEVVLSVGGIDEVNVDCFDSFDYAALAWTYSQTAAHRTRYSAICGLNLKIFFFRGEYGQGADSCRT